MLFCNDKKGKSQVHTTHGFVILLFSIVFFKFQFITNVSDMHLLEGLCVSVEISSSYGRPTLGMCRLPGE